MKKKFIVPVRYVLILFLLPVGACQGRGFLNEFIISDSEIFYNCKQ